MPHDTAAIGADTAPMAMRLTQVAVGTALMGVAVALLLRAAALGLLPLDILHRALGDLLGVTIGTAIVTVQGLLLLVNLAVKIRPGIGTVAAVVIPAAVADLTLTVLPASEALWARIAALLLGGTMFAAGTALYLAADLGALPRDGLMLAVAHRTGWGLARIRVSADLICLTIGVLIIGPATAIRTGTLGVGSVLLAAGLGPGIARLLRFAPTPPAPRPST
ncbi:MAG: hypothetical protein QOF58_1922 [Pseudonocardiales bacterium]|jgi:uncharacterized membrane protein YczE|nr:hypothetical protein [Pseudonocardiales bacterium]